jgi:hypothetical protein
VAYLREEREAGVPKSFSRLDLFFKERRVELADFLNETTEVAASDGRQRVDEALEVEDSEEEIGPEDYLLESAAESADEDLSDPDEDEQ